MTEKEALLHILDQHTKAIEAINKTLGALIANVNLLVQNQIKKR